MLLSNLHPDDGEVRSTDYRHERRVEIYCSIYSITKTLELSHRDKGHVAISKHKEYICQICKKYIRSVE